LQWLSDVLGKMDAALRPPIKPLQIFDLPDTPETSLPHSGVLNE